MGSDKYYDALTGKVTVHNYISLGEINNIKVIMSTGEVDNGLPRHSITSNIYFYYSKKKKAIIRVGFYDENHTLIKRMDWDHTHKDFKKGTPHIQYFTDNEAHALNEEEQKIFDELKRRNFQYEN